jgi:hypothetical protein
MYSTYLYTPLHSDGAGEDHVLSHCHVFSGSLVYVRRRNITEIKNISNEPFLKLTFSITVSLQFLILFFISDETEKTYKSCGTIQLKECLVSESTSAFLGYWALGNIPPKKFCETSH